METAPGCGPAAECGLHPPTWTPLQVSAVQVQAGEESQACDLAFNERSPCCADLWRPLPPRGKRNPGVGSVCLCFCPGWWGQVSGRESQPPQSRLPASRSWEPWRPALSPWTRGGREQEEGSGGAGLGALWDRGHPALRPSVPPVPGAQGRNLKASALAQSNLTRPAGRGGLIWEQAQQLGRPPSRFQEAGLAGEQRKDRPREKGRNLATLWRSHRPPRSHALCRGHALLEPRPL